MYSQLERRYETAVKEVKRSLIDCLHILLSSKSASLQQQENEYADLTVAAAAGSLG
jgi:hypothetical protein